MKKLAYQVLGQGEKKICLLHGFLENSKMWKAYAGILQEKYQVLMIDLPGHGESPNYSDVHPMDFMAEKVIEIMDEVDFQTTAVIGHSMGGYVALALAKLFPERLKGMMLFFSTPLADTEEKKDARLKAIELYEKAPDDFIKHSIKNLFDGHNLVHLKPQINYAREMAHTTSPEGIKAALRGMRLRENCLDFFNGLDIPKAVLLGSEDKAVDSATLMPLLAKEVMVKELPIGHMGHLEAPDQSFAFIEVFLDQIF